MFVKLIPAVKNYIWGGTTLNTWGKKSNGNIAETWELSFHPDGLSRVAPDGTKALAEIVSADDLGVNCAKFNSFPVLVKYIDAMRDLSVQVHPDDQYAMRVYGQQGKTEMWYILDSKPYGGVYLGTKEIMSASQFRQAVEEDSVIDKLKFFPVKRGDCIYIPAGTVHAIGKGVTLCEIQQNSNLTFRMYDYKRTDADGKPRELHLEDALKVARLTPCEMPFVAKLPFACKYFSLNVHNKSEIIGNADSFVCVTVTKGCFTAGGLQLGLGDTAFLSAGEKVFMEGEGEYMTVWTD